MKRATVEVAIGPADKDPQVGTLAKVAAGLADIEEGLGEWPTPRYFSAADDLLAALREAIALLRELEWAGADGTERYCPACGGAKTYDGWVLPHAGHAHDCKLAEAIGAPRRAK